MKIRDEQYAKVQEQPRICLKRFLLWTFCAVATYPMLGFSGCWAHEIDEKISDKREVFSITGVQVDPAANAAITYPNQPFIPMLQRQANCSLTRFVLDQNYNVLAMDGRSDRPNDRRPVGGEISLALVLLGLSGLANQRRRWCGSRWSTLLSALLVAVVATVLVACGGGGAGGSTGTSTTTPAGTSTVTVTATAGSLSKTAAFTFTVQ
jgi:hypothetical protein